MGLTTPLHRSVATSGQVAAQIEGRFAAGFAMIAGYVDACGYSSFQTYVSFMSGNTTQTGYVAGQGHALAALPTLVAIVSFVIGVFSGTWLAHSGTHHSWRLRSGLVAGLLAISIGLAMLGWSGSALGIATLSVAMGIMNTALSHIGAQSVSLTFVTGTLVGVGRHLALAVRRATLPDARGPWDTHGRRALHLLGAWAGFLTGAVLGSAATARFGVSALLLPLLILSALPVFSRAQSTSEVSST